MRNEIRAVSEDVDTLKSRIVLKLEGITYGDVPNGAFEVYIDLPPSVNPDHRNICYAGNIGLFGMMGHGGKEMNMQEGGSVLLDITTTIRRLNINQVDLEQIKVSVIHKGASVRTEQNIRGEIRIRSITLYGLEHRAK
jgi:hypothetical protein